MYMLADYDKSTHYDLLVMGSSHAYRGYDPRIFSQHGYSMFNAGTSSQSPEIGLHLLKNHLIIDENQLVIMDVYPLIFTLEGHETKWRWIVHDDHRWDAVKLAISEPDFRSLNTLVKRLICENEGIEYTIDGYVGNGYCTMSDTLDFDFAFEPKTFNPRTEVADDFKELVSQIVKKGARLLLVNHPMPQASQQPDLTPFLDSLGIKVPYLDYTHQPGFGLAYFGDASHLNQAGVNKFNELLLKDLLERGYLKP